MEAGTGNTDSTAPTARVLRLPGRAARDARGARGAPDERASEGEGLELVRAAYEAAGGSCARPVEMRPLARRMGLDPRAVEELAMRLQAQRLVRVVSMANGLLRLTPEGARAIERATENAVSDPPESGPPGPAAPTDAPRAGGNLVGARAVPAAPVIGAGALRELEELLGALKTDLDLLDLGGALDEGRRSELAAEVRTIEAQLGSPKPKRGIVAAGLESVRGIVRSTGDEAGGAESERILRAIDAFLDGAGRATPSVRRVAGLARRRIDPKDGSGLRRPEEEEAESASNVGAREAGGVRVRRRVRDDSGQVTGWARGPGQPTSEGANEAVGEAGEGAGAAAEDVGAARAVRGAEGAAGRAGDGADRATMVREAEADRRVLPVVRRVLRAVDETGDGGGAVGDPRDRGEQSAERSVTGKAVRVPRVQDLMAMDVVTIESSAGVVEAAKRMIQEEKGPLPVMEGNRPVAMVTDRDLVAYVIAQGLDPNVVTLEDVQTRPLITIESDRDAEEARRLMDEHGLDRLVVVDDDELAGVISEADLRSDEGPLT